MAERITTAASYAASGSLMTIGGLALNEWFAAIGLALAIATFIVNWVYKQKNYNLERKRKKDGEIW